MNVLLSDLRYAARTLTRNPGYAIVVILTLGLGIGANTAIFSVISGVLLKPLPYADGDRLVLLRQSAPLAGRADTGISIKEYFQYREQARDLHSLVEYHQMSFDLLKRGEPDRVDTAVVSHNFFDVLGIRPLHGRTLVADDDKPGADAVLVLGYSYWRNRFNGDPDIVGQVFEMNGRPHTVVGVLPNVPMYPQENDVYMPVLACPFRAAAQNRIAENPRIFSALTVFGRLTDGATRERAGKEVEAICGRFTTQDTRAYRPDSGFTATTLDVRNELTSNARPMLLILLGTTGLILLLACANVANLTLARLLRRDRELAVRAALGAGRTRLFRQLLTESLAVATLGGVVGLVFATATVGLLTTFIARFTQRVQEVAIDPWVLAFTVGLSLVTGLLFGTLPALSPAGDTATRMKQAGKGAGAPRTRVQQTLVVVQVALSVVLLVGAALLLASFNRLQRVNPGYTPEHVLSAEIFGNFTKYPNGARLRELYFSLLERLEAQPGIVSAAITNGVPLSPTVQQINAPFQIAGRTTDNPDRRPTADVRVVTERYFDTLRVPLLQGRAFQPSDTVETPLVAIVNRSMTRHWEGTDPIGSRVSFDNGQNWATVIGVIGDFRQFTLDRDSAAQAYVSLRQSQNQVGGRVLVRTVGDSANAVATLRAAVRALDPDMPIENVRTLDELRDGTLATPRLTAMLLSIFAGLALAVTLAGVTGVMATSVAHRTQEFGLRMALGARRGQVMTMVLRQGLVLVVLGVGIGLVASLLLAPLLSTMLFQTPPWDPIAFAAVGIVLATAGLVSCFGPAWRATTADPLNALRTE